ncbi:UNVERIFIED_CONTAM: hypothetical protein RMT77_007082 [Armadillidium vulgare]|nr:putative transcriptional regulatory protein [Armadillidium vulgare]
MNMNCAKVCYQQIFRNSLFLKNSFKIIKSSEITLPRNLNKSLMHTSAITMAGHSKWANIKHTKGLKDLEKSRIFSKYIQLLKLAIKDGGGSIDPKINTSVAKVIEQCMKHNVPMSTVDSALKKYEKQAQNAKPGSLCIISPSKLTVSVELFTDNLNRTRNEVRSIIKKANFKEHKMNVEDFFEEKGFVIAKSKDKDINKAVDDAIEAGAEDVTEEEGMLTFVCEANDFYKVRNEIEKMNYDIDYADVEKIPHVMVPVNEDESDRVKLMLSRLEDHEEVVKVYCNFEL